jgi:hypothetical protein
MDEAALAFTPRRAAVPIWIAANTPQGLANAARIGDGILLDAGASPEYAANAVAIVRSAAAAAGRDAGRLEIAQLINTSIDDDPRRALQAVRGRSRRVRYPRTPKFKLAVGEPHIDPADLPRFAAAYLDVVAAALTAALSDSYVAGMSAAGTLDAVRARILAYRRAGVTLPLLRPAAPEQTERLGAAFGAGSGDVAERAGSPSITASARRARHVRYLPGAVPATLLVLAVGASCTPSTRSHSPVVASFGGTWERDLRADLIGPSKRTGTCGSSTPSASQPRRWRDSRPRRTIRRWTS